MRYLGLALYAEGGKDYSFLPPVLRALVEDVCLRRSREIVEISDVLPLDTPAGFEQEERATRILEAARQGWGAFSVLFIHTDGGGDHAAASAERVEPAARELAALEDGEGARVAAVIPVRETEAWALADGDALRGAFGTTLADRDFGLPVHPREVEKIGDPKQALEEAYRRAAGRRQKRTAAHHLQAIALRVRLERLRKVPSFVRCEDDLTAALEDLGYFGGRHAT